MNRGGIELERPHRCFIETLHMYIQYIYTYIYPYTYTYTYTHTQIYIYLNNPS
jgi:hypothetical protein